MSTLPLEVGLEWRKSSEDLKKVNPKIKLKHRFWVTSSLRDHTSSSAAARHAIQAYPEQADVDKNLRPHQSRLSPGLSTLPDTAAVWMSPEDSEEWMPSSEVKYVNLK
jgi:cytochrome c1